MVLNSIRSRMTAAFVAALALLLLLASISILWYTRRTTARSTAAILHHAADKVKQEIHEDLSGEMDDSPRHKNDSGVAPPLQGHNHEGVSSGQQSHTDSMRPSADKEVSSAHSLLIRLGNETEEEPEARGIGILIVNSQGRILERSYGATPSWPPGHDWQITTIPYGDWTIVLGLPLDKYQRAIRAEALDLLAIGLIVLCASAVGAWLLVGRTLLPIQQLSRQAAGASSDQLRVELQARSGDSEIVELVHTLNALLSRIAETAEAKGQFYAAASHELRTPLQALSGHLGVTLSRTRTSEEYRSALETANQQTERLTSLVHSLLFLNQLEVATAPPATQPVDVAEFCEGALNHFSVLIRERQLQVQVTFPEDAEAMAPPTHVAMLVRNVIENALKYSPDKGDIQIAVRKNPEGVTLMIRNSCRTPTQWDTDRIFEPFYRPDISRNTETGGNGLGLAICKALCLLNRWELEVTQDQEKVQVAIEFPLHHEESLPPW